MTVTREAAQAFLVAVHGDMEAHQEALDRLDAVAGDGDHGGTMVLGWRGVARAIEQTSSSSLGDLLKEAGTAFAEVGGSIGPLWGTALLRAGRELSDEARIDLAAVARAVAAAVAGIRERGRCLEGDKTLLDVLAPASRALSEAADAGSSVQAAAAESLTAARAGLEATSGMPARRGRASRVSERSVGHQDAGAASAYLVWRLAVVRAGGDPEPPDGVLERPEPSPVGGMSDSRDGVPGGRLAALGPEDVLRALMLVDRGRVYDLERERWNGMPVFEGHAGFHVLSYRTPRGLQIDPSSDVVLGSNDVGAAWVSELISGSAHSGTHVDALSHVTVGPDGKGYGDFRADAHVGDFGVTLHDATTIPPIITRGVLLDVASAKGVPHLAGGYPIGHEDLEAALERQSTELKHNDAVLVRTGYPAESPDAAMDDRAAAGLTLDAAEYLIQRGAVLLGADTEALEVEPSGVVGDPMPVHVACLVRYGVHILEHAYLEELAADRRYEFAFICSCPRIRGATAGLARPLALV